MLITDYLESSFSLNENNDLIITDDFILSYEYCRRLSDFFASEIKKKNTKSKVVAIMMEKGWEQIIAVFSVLKSGRSYLPINLSESRERNLEILKLCEVEIILVQNDLENISIENTDKIVIYKKYIKFDSGTPNSKNRMNIFDDLAYIIFTSGSTGMPKGVMINHKPVLNTILYINEKFNVNNTDKILFLSALNFDLSVYDILGSAISGASIVVPNASESNEPKYLAELISNKKVTVWNSVPVFMEMLINYIEKTENTDNERDYSSLRLVLLSGDWIPVLLPDKIRKIFKNAKVISLGGATEASIWSIMYEINKVPRKWKSIPYGKPIKNQFFYILNDNLEKVNYGDVGQLYIGGIGLSEGYWKDEKNTKLNFLHHESFNRIYRTGDIGRYMPDGNIEFLGRIDSQVKINGYRVELGAIETSILKQDEITRALVMPVKEKNICKGLLAYINIDEDKWKIHEKCMADNVIKSWEKSYDSVIINYKDNTFNTSGWISSYTGLEIPEREMREWVEITVKNIIDLKPSKVLEIGCGTGLILFKILPYINEYHGTDISKATLNHLKETLNENKENKNIFFYNIPAHGISKIENTYDTIIINSVSQYFPNLDYMVNVVNLAISLTKPGGNIYIGDIRNYKNIEHYYLSTILHDLKNVESLNDIDYQLHELSLKQRELIISPLVFTKKFLSNKRISNVSLKLKPGKYDNEMNAFRYDIIINIENNKNIIKPDRENHYCWQKDNMNTISLYKILMSGKNDYFAFDNIPNKKIWFLDNLLNQCRNKKPLNLAFSDINCPNFGVELHDLYDIAKSTGYEIVLTFSESHAMKTIKAIFYKKNNDQVYFFHSSFPNETDDIKVSNNPVKNIYIQDLILKIKYSLKTELPYYMIPDNIIYLEEIPLNKNGKIDRTQLPYIDFFIKRKKIKHQFEHDTNINETDLKIMNMISKALNNIYLDTDYSFRENGGTSLDAVHLIAEIYNEFFINIDLKIILDEKMSLKNILGYVKNKIMEEINLAV